MALLGEQGNTWNMPVIGGYVANITTPHGWGNYNTSHYRWVLPSAGWYELHANLRVRVWGTTGFSQFRILRASDSNAYGGTDNVKMGVEFQDSGRYNNTQVHNMWKVYTTGAETFYLQGNSSVNSSGHSIQSDTNGRPELFWRRIG